MNSSACPAPASGTATPSGSPTASGSPAPTASSSPRSPQPLFTAVDMALGDLKAAGGRRGGERLAGKRLAEFIEHQRVLSYFNM